MINILIVIMIISFLVLIHELGHFLVARRHNVAVEEFGFGYPPRIMSLFTYKGTLFTLNAIPIGGFVRLLGESGDFESSSTPIVQSKHKKDYGEAFFLKSAWARALIIGAGVATNLLFTVLAFSLVFSFLGIPSLLEGRVRIGQIAPDSPAAYAQLPTNVEILEIHALDRSYQVDGIEMVQRAVQENRGQELELIITGLCQGLNCEDSRSSYKVYARLDEETPEGQGALGIVFDEYTLHFYPIYQMPFRGTWYGIKQTVALSGSIINALKDMFVQVFTAGSVPKDIAGPVGIVHQAHQGNLVSTDFWSNLGFAGMLSLNLAIMNLLPIPALDGGKLLFIGLEGLFGKKKTSKIEGYANYGGFAIIVILIVAITIKDIVQLF